jgi:hypothetical protein
VTPPPRHLVWGVAAAALAAGLAATLVYADRELTLSHYDAKAHLVVARRIFDSLTPGWRQIGAVWLPLPHLLNAIPVQVDAFYRTGASAVTISLLGYVAMLVSLAVLVWQATRSRAAAVAAAVVAGSDPNVLYLQATPMTEALLFGLTTGGVALTHRWLQAEGRQAPRAAGLVLAAACLTRYEAWPVTAAAGGLAWVALLRGGVGPGDASRRVARLLAPTVAAVVAFLVLSRVTVGEWFVTGGFYVPDARLAGKPWATLAAVGWGVWQILGTVTVAAGVLGATAIVAAALARRRHAPALVALALAGTMALPFYAFYKGHPYRVRYMVAPVMAVAACGGIGLGLIRRRELRLLAAAGLTLVTVVETPPLSARAPFVQEAQWDRPKRLGRRAVTGCLASGFRRPDDKILVSMGSLAHYMQELSAEGFALDDFVHEGVGQLFPEAFTAPRRHVRWILAEEDAEGGDMMTWKGRQDPAFLEGFARTCEGGGVALYERRPPAGSSGPAPGATGAPDTR